jgi:hypothetical protein
LSDKKISGEGFAYNMAKPAQAFTGSIRWATETNSMV